MAISRVKTWTAETLTAADINAEFDNIINNALSLISPLTAGLNGGGFALTNLTVETADVGPHSFGTTVVNYSQFRIGGAFTSGGASTVGYKLLMDGALTGLTGDTDRLAGAAFNNTITTQGASETIGTVAQVVIFEPNITIGTGDTVTDAVSLLIASAPTEGSNNYAQYNQSGVTRFDGNVGMGTNSFGTSGTNVLSITADGTVPSSNPAGVIQIYADDSSAGATDATLALRLETDPVAIGTFTASHKFPVWINGTEYHIQLDAV